MATSSDSKEVGRETSSEQRSEPVAKDSYSPSSTDETLSQWSEEDQKKILRKVDIRLIPTCGLLYCMCLLDRTNLSSAAIAG